MRTLSSFAPFLMRGGVGVGRSIPLPFARFGALSHSTLLSKTIFPSHSLLGGISGALSASHRVSFPFPFQSAFRTNSTTATRSSAAVGASFTATPSSSSSSSSASSESSASSQPTLSVPPALDPTAFTPATTADLLARRDNVTAPVSTVSISTFHIPVESAAHLPAIQSHLSATAKPSLDVGSHGYLHPHPLWAGEYLESVQITHRVPEDALDTFAYNLIRVIRFNFDLFSGYLFGRPTTSKVIRRIVFLESIAAIPGSIAGILRHLASLRRLQRDNGWIHSLYGEAENERMHLLTALEVEKPGPIMKAAVFVSQGIFYNFFFLAYMLSPRLCHRLVGYLEEQAVKTYTQVIQEIDSGSLGEWKTTPAPEIAIEYWKMDKKATMRDVMLMIRADEAHHRQVNHVFGDLKPTDLNPFKPGL